MVQDRILASFTYLSISLDTARQISKNLEIMPDRRVELVRREEKGEVIFLVKSLDLYSGNRIKTFREIPYGKDFFASLAFFQTWEQQLSSRIVYKHEASP